MSLATLVTSCKWNHIILVCKYYTCFQVESYNTFAFGLYLFNIMSSESIHIEQALEFPSFLMMNNIPVYDYTIICLLIHPWMNIGLFSFVGYCE